MEITERLDAILAAGRVKAHVWRWRGDLFQRRQQRGEWRSVCTHIRYRCGCGRWLYVGASGGELQSDAELSLDQLNEQLPLSEL